MIAAGQPFTGIGSVPHEERVIYEFPVPEKYQKADDQVVKSVGVFELTPDEELMAARRAGGDNISMSLELTRQALAEVNGVSCTIGDGTTDVWFKKFCPQLRALIVSAYADINTPKESEAKDFLKGRKAKVR